MLPDLRSHHHYLVIRLQENLKELLAKGDLTSRNHPDSKEIIQPKKFRALARDFFRLGPALAIAPLPTSPF
jgi:hypothetical protein